MLPKIVVGCLRDGASWFGVGSSYQPSLWRILRMLGDEGRQHYFRLGVLTLEHRTSFRGLIYPAGATIFARFCLIALLGLISVSAKAATFTEMAAGDNQVFIVVRGEFADGDADKFNMTVQKYAKGGVLFESAGGNLVTGVRIGEIIRLKGFSTGVASGAVCASSCALAWLGGSERFLPSSARLGFHAAYRIEGANAQETGMGNALIGAYLTRIGLPLEAVLYITQASPSEMTWLTPEAAKKVGITMTVAELPQPDAKPTEPLKPAIVPKEISIIAPLGAPTAVLPSFDCAHAAGDDEKVICSDPLLARADNLIGNLYKTQVHSTPWLRKFLRIHNVYRSSCHSDPLCIISIQSQIVQTIQSSTPKWMEDYKTNLVQSGRGNVWQPVLPTVIGHCVTTSFLDISDRFGEPLTPELSADGFDSGSSASFRNGGWVVSYSKEPVLLASRIGDKTTMCLVSIPKGCPPGDDRGRTYRITNLRTGLSGILADAQHMCGGA